MRSPSSSNRRFFLVAVLTLLGGAAALASLWPLATQAARHHADQLVVAAASAPASEAEVNYRLALWLNPHHTTAHLGLARSAIASGQADKALELLERAGEGSVAAELRVRTLIELGRHNAAADAARSLLRTPATQEQVFLAILAYSLAGRSADINNVSPRLSSPEALQRVAKLQTNGLALANELSATGLLESSRAMLDRQPVTFERNLQLARLYYQFHQPTDLEQAVALLTVASKLNPANTEHRRLLAQIYRAQQKFAEASAQDTFVVKLEAGRP